MAYLVLAMLGTKRVERKDVKNPFQIMQYSFERFLINQRESGAISMSYEDIHKYVVGKEKKRRNGFIVTFDDIYDSVYEHAYPFLKSQQIPFILFVTVDLIGKPNYVTLEHLKEMANSPLCTIGAHGINHSVFRNLSREEAIQSYQNSKIQLEDLLGVNVPCFAFPYGRRIECSCNNINDLKHSGLYDMGFSAMSATLHESWLSGNYFLPRINVEEDMV